jgi:hypothetical protein
MAGRSEAQKSPAFAALSVGGQRVLKVIEQAGRDGVAISLDQFMERADLCRSSVRRGIRQCELVGFVTVSIGARRCSVFALADGWRRLDADVRSTALPGLGGNHGAAVTNSNL